MKKLVILFVILIVLLIVTVGMYFSPVGSYFLKNYVKEKLCFADKFKTTYFNHSINSFSMTLSNKDGLIQVFGTFLPFNASYNANFDNIGAVIDFLKGNLNSTGELAKNKNGLHIKGNYIYSKGYGNLDLNCNINNKLSGFIEGKNFNTKIFLNNIKGFEFPIFHYIPLEGSNDLKFKLKDNAEIMSDFNGYMNINNFKFPMMGRIKLNFLNESDFAFNSVLSSKELYGNVKGLKNNKSLNLDGNLDKFDLKLIRKNVLYPIKGIVKLKFKYNNQSKVFSFKSDYFNGYSDGETVNIQISMPLKEFFDFLNMPYVLKGKISGNIIINKNRGLFNLLIESASFISTDVLKKLDSIIHFKLEKTKSIFFLNGSFDTQKIVFDFISKNPAYYIYLKKGIYYYGGLYNLNFDLKTKTDSYKFNITNGQIKLLDHINQGINYKTLVY